VVNKGLIAEPGRERGQFEELLEGYLLQCGDEPPLLDRTVRRSLSLVRTSIFYHADLPRFYFRPDSRCSIRAFRQSEAVPPVVKLVLRRQAILMASLTITFCRKR
jgi:hypothetical protein